MSTENKDGGTRSLRLSYSSLQEILTCQTKYSHRKVWNTPLDEAEDSEALNVGKAFHQVLEKTHHNEVIDEHVRMAVKEFNCQERLHLIKAMAVKYVELHKLSGLQVVKVEYEVMDLKRRGFIDALMVDDNQGWWICDLKTAAKFDPNLLPRLPKDLQLNSYATYASEMEARIPELIGRTFKGCRYRVTTKPKTGTKWQEILEKVQAYDIVIPFSVMLPKLAEEVFSEVYPVAVALHNGQVPIKNLKACFDFFRPCPYFSKCHGSKFNDSFDKVTVFTSAIYKELDSL